jgi:hypothetical protein
MNLKTQKLILHFLKGHKKRYNHNEERNSFFDDFFSKDELKEIIQHIYGDTCFNSNHQEEGFSEKELFSLIKHDSFFLSYLIEKIEMELGALPSYIQADITVFFESVNLEMHYLATKRVEAWDEYDRSNYHSLMRKTGKTKRIFALYFSDVKEEDKYKVTTPPSRLFDTSKEAKEELERLIKEEKFKTGELKILPLWKINN